MDSDVSTSSSARDMKDHKRTGVDGEDVLAQDTQPGQLQSRTPRTTESRASEDYTQREATDMEGTGAPQSHRAREIRRMVYAL